MSRIILPNAGIQRWTMAPHLLRRVESVAVEPPALDDLEDIGDWFSYHFPEDVFESAGDVTIWIDSSVDAGPGTKNMFPANSPGAPDAIANGSGAFWSRQSALTPHQGVGVSCDVNRSTFDSWTHGMLFTAFTVEQFVVSSMIFGFTSIFSSRWIRFQTYDAGGGQYGVRCSIDRPSGVSGGRNEFEIAQGLDIGTTYTIAAVANGTTIRMFVDGRPSVGDKTLSSVDDENEWDWFASMDQTMSNYSIGCRVEAAGDNEASNGQRQTMKFGGTIGGTSIITDEQVRQVHNFVVAAL